MEKGSDNDLRSGVDVLENAQTYLCPEQNRLALKRHEDRHVANRSIFGNTSAITRRDCHSPMQRESVSST